MNPVGVSIPKNWNLLKTVMDISYEIRDKYNIDKVRSPKNFMALPIANSLSINDWLGESSIDWQERTLLFEFLGNRVDEVDEEISERLNEAQGNKVYCIYLNNSSSDILTEAHFMQSPVISFATSSNFQHAKLNAELNVLDNSGTITKQDVVLHNFHQMGSITFYQPFLVEWKKKIKFRDSEWIPEKKPIWNDTTSKTLKELNFPQSISVGEKQAEVLRVGSIVAEMNGWCFDERVTKLNKNEGQLRKIFRSENSKSTYYLSVDVEKTYGAYELLNHKGKHLGEISFNDDFRELKPDTDGYHDIKVK